jgi:hypothetical protein
MVRINYKCTLTKLPDGSIRLESILIVHGGKHITFQLKRRKLMHSLPINHNKILQKQTYSKIKSKLEQ